jgi:hypothetical protein
MSLRATYELEILLSLNILNQFTYRNISTAFLVGFHTKFQNCWLFLKDGKSQVQRLSVIPSQHRIPCSHAKQSVLFSTNSELVTVFSSSSELVITLNWNT